jgi:FlaA1/EpsC-like NDP-sugar epimerase
MANAAASTGASLAASPTRLVHRLAGPVELLIDVLAWAVAATAALYLRFELDPQRANLVALAKFIPLTAIVQIAIGLAIGLYRRRYQYGSFEEVKALVGTVALATVVLCAIDVWYLGVPRNLPLSAVLFGGVVGLVIMAGARYVVRLWSESRRRPRGDNLERVLVVGAGEAGLRGITAMLNDPEGVYQPVGIIDDDPAKRRLSVKGVPVVGTTTEVIESARATGADTLLIAVPALLPEQVEALTERAQAANLRVKVLPSVHELLGADASADDIRELSDNDLLGRRQISTDIDSIASYIRGRRVLVTGAGGSIGSELCRQLARLSPAALMMLDRDESALHAVQLSIEGRALLDTPNLLLADLRDAERMNEIFEERRPHVVFHAAALKHLTLLEQYPAEAFKTNVQGTANVLRAAIASGVERFVNVSTDKAANPTCVLGTSKRVAERLAADAATRSSGVVLSVRFGNVLGSRGSVLTTFRSQIASGGPVTVTDPSVTRFFMTVQEAVQLVIQAGAIGRDGEVLVLDMGEPVSINHVAEQMIRQSGKQINIVYTGLRPGEKMHEELFGDNEVDERPIHPMISHAAVPPLGDVALGEAGLLTPEATSKWMTEHCEPSPADHAR